MILGSTKRLMNRALGFKGYFFFEKNSRIHLEKASGNNDDNLAVG